MKVKVSNIKWDTDEIEFLKTLPKEAELDLPLYHSFNREAYEEISDCLFNEYGFCVNGFTVEPKEGFNLHERATVVRAIDTLARCINDEDIFYGYLSVGVADGDIQEDTTDEELEYYCRDVNFADLMERFMSYMARAKKSGGLYCDGVVSKLDA